MNARSAAIRQFAGLLFRLSAKYSLNCLSTKTLQEPNPKDVLGILHDMFCTYTQTQQSALEKRVSVGFTSSVFYQLNLFGSEPNPVSRCPTNSNQLKNETKHLSHCRRFPECVLIWLSLMEMSVWTLRVQSEAERRPLLSRTAPSSSHSKLDSNMQGILYKVYRYIFEDNYCLYY